jgi:hypothetical protein
MRAWLGFFFVCLFLLCAGQLLLSRFFFLPELFSFFGFSVELTVK